jgi:thymidylate synthase
MHPMRGSDHNEAYVEMTNAVLSDGSLMPSRNGDTRELIGAVVEVTNPRRPFISAEGRVVNPAFALAEVLWILAGRRDVATISSYNKHVASFSDDGLTFNAAYGHRLRAGFGHDQLDDVVAKLEADPDTRQATLVIADPRYDRSFRPQASDYQQITEGGFGAMHQVPHVTKDRACNVAAHMLVRDGHLRWTQFMRSNDVTWGTPYNFVQWSHLQEYVASRVGVEVGSYTHFAHSLHSYSWSEDLSDVHYFNVYSALGHDHGPRGIEDEQVEQLLAAQQLLWGESVDPMMVPCPDVPDYWRSVFDVLRAYVLNKRFRPVDAAFVLAQPSMDPVLAALTARHLAHHYWWKPHGSAIGVATTSDGALGALRLVHDTQWGSNDEVWEWIRGSAKRRAVKS